MFTKIKIFYIYNLVLLNISNLWKWYKICVHKAGNNENENTYNQNNLLLTAPDNFHSLILNKLYSPLSILATYDPW